jgi:hypothetical protein
VFYTETVRVTVRNIAGAAIMTFDGTCNRDLRTTVTLDCDPQAHTVPDRTSPKRLSGHASARGEA